MTPNTTHALTAVLALSALWIFVFLAFYAGIKIVTRARGARGQLWSFSRRPTLRYPKIPVEFENGEWDVVP